MKICWICGSPYQLLNCINYIWHYTNSKKDTIDLYLEYRFWKVEMIRKRISEENLFTNIYGYSQNMRKTKIHDIPHKLVQVVFPEKYLEESITDETWNLQQDYNVIFTNWQSRFAEAIVLCSKNAKVYYYDDGTASYKKHFGNKKRMWIKALYFLCGHKVRKLVPTALYVNGPEYCRNVDIDDIRSFPLINQENKEFRAVLNRIFDYQNDGYYSKYRLIYTAQSIQWEKDSEFNDQIINVLKHYKEFTLIRPHPRQENLTMGELRIDDHRSMWELVCADQITDEHILMGVFSTAQVTPKLMYGKEPYLIILYGALDLSKESRRIIGKLVNQLKSIYQHPEKIAVINDILELPEVLHKFNFVC